MIVYCTAFGSSGRGRSGWARIRAATPEVVRVGGDPEEFVALVCADLRTQRVALGFEYPLFVPIRFRRIDLFRIRQGEGDRRFSAAHGKLDCNPGWTHVAWVLRRIADLTDEEIPAFVDWDAFSRAARGLFVWEAFVSDPAEDPGESGVHTRNALFAVRAFLAALPDPRRNDAVDEQAVYSIAGAALLRAGMAFDPRILSTPTLVINRAADAS